MGWEAEVGFDDSQDLFPWIFLEAETCGTLIPLLLVSGPWAC